MNKFKKPYHSIIDAEVSGGVCIVIAILALLFGGVFYLEYPNVVCVIKEWQTLIAGLLALFGAALTVHVMQAQRREQRRSKQRAARFSLSASLVEICDISKAGISYLREQVPKKPTSKYAGEEDDNLLLPIDGFSNRISDIAFNNLKEIAEHFDNEVSIAIEKIGQKYQLCIARTENRDLLKNEKMRYEIICDFADLHARANRLFLFSWGEVNTVDISPLQYEEIVDLILPARTMVYNEKFQKIIHRRYAMKTN